MKSDDVQGTWVLLDWVQDYDDGRRIYPFGEDAVGTIVYSGDRMSCIMSRSGRAPFAAGGQWNADDADKARAYGEMMAYAGGFSIEGNEVLHHVDLSLFPNWIGGVQRRRAALNGDRLSLTARLEEGTRDARTARLEWRRHILGDGESGGAVLRAAARE